jgi:hypothetical protein
MYTKSGYSLRRSLLFVGTALVATAVVINAQNSANGFDPESFINSFKYIDSPETSVNINNTQVLSKEIHELITDI